MFQNVAALLLRQIDIENPDIRARLNGVCIRAVEKLNRLLAISNNVQVGGDVRRLNSSQDEVHIRLVILDDQDLPADGQRRFLSWGS